jgi:hypothetical protein
MRKEILIFLLKTKLLSLNNDRVVYFFKKNQFDNITYLIQKHDYNEIRILYVYDWLKILLFSSIIIFMELIPWWILFVCRCIESYTEK